MREILEKMAKRAAEAFEDDFMEDSKRAKPQSSKKHTLDSDEEDSGEDDERWDRDLLLIFIYFTFISFQIQYYE